MKNIPKFRNEQDEAEFWKNNDSTEFIDWKNAKNSNFTHLKPSIRSISLRLPEMMLSRLKLEANRMDIPYQSLMKILISDGLDKREKINN